MNSVPSIPGFEVGAPWLGSCAHVLTTWPPGLLATLYRTFGPRRGAARGARGPRRRAGRRGVEDAAGTVSDIIAARILPAEVEMMDARAPRAALTR